MPELYIGLMSGTSMDAIDAVLVDLAEDRPRLLRTRSHPIPGDLRDELAALAAGGGMVDYGRVDHRFGLCLADAVRILLEDAELAGGSIAAIGSHGQSIWHQPDKPYPFTLQIGDPNLIAQHTGITTVADFRRRDMAAGGQGAPLAPALHEALFRDAGEARVVLNIGGIGNITVLPADATQPVTGFDTGPGNTLMDHWFRLHHDDGRFDASGDWAASGTVDRAFLERLAGDPYFSAPPPKSTGPEYFNLAWLDQHLAGGLSPQDVQATLAELTATSIADAVRRLEGMERVLVCGGGVHNRYLVQRLASHLPGLTVESTATRGLDPDWVEAVAFAWLARRTLRGLPGNIPSVTGAAQAVILGAIYRA